MARKKIEDDQLQDVELDDTTLDNEVEQHIGKREVEESLPKFVETKASGAGEPLINCLREETIEVRHIDNGKFPSKHVFSGGMAPEAVKTFSVPMLENGTLKNVLTNAEKKFLEKVLDLGENGMSIYKKGEDNFWSDANPKGVGKVSLKRDNNYLHLDNPVDYIKYKILLANEDYIAPSLGALTDNPKDTYQFVMVSEGAETKIRKSRMDYMKDCYKLFGKYEDDKATLRLIVETVEGRPTSSDVKLEFLQSRCGDAIEQSPKNFYTIITDPLLRTKVLIKRCVEAGLISLRNTYYYLSEGGQPLSFDNQDSTLENAATYLNDPKNQGLFLALQAKLK